MSLHPMSSVLLLAILVSGCGEGRLLNCRDAGEHLPNGKSVELGRCCWGLEARSLYFSEVVVDGVSYCKADNDYFGVNACLPCGDGVCDPYYEDRCLCPEDCGEIPESRYVDVNSELPMQHPSAPQ